MKILCLHFNSLTEVPDNLGENLLDLENLFLKNNSLESIPKSFQNLRKLKRLELDNNKLITLPNIFEKVTGLRSGKGILYINNNPTMTSLPDSIRFVKNTLSTRLVKNAHSASFPSIHNSSMIEHAPLLAMVDLRYQRWCDRKPLLLMKPKKGVDLKKCAAMYEVLLARLDNQYGDPARSSGLVKHIASFLGPRPNHVTNEAIAKYRRNAVIRK